MITNSPNSRNIIRQYSESEGFMVTGLEWLGSAADNSGFVRVLLDDGSTTELRDAVAYVLGGLEPPIYELPFTTVKSANSDLAMAQS